MVYFPPLLFLIAFLVKSETESRREKRREAKKMADVLLVSQKNKIELLFH